MSLNSRDSRIDGWLIVDTLLLLAIIPLLLCACSWLIPGSKSLGRTIAIGMLGHVALVAWLMLPVLTGATGHLPLPGGFTIDKVASCFIVLTAVVAAAALCHAHVFFAHELTSPHAPDLQQIRMFYFLSLLFLLAMTAVYLCDNLGFMWICIETTTLVSAGLVYYSRTKHALEATWKYFIICSVAIAFALLGTILLFASSQHGALSEGSLNVSDLIPVAPRLDLTLSRLAFIFCFLGYGTKAGVFPLHSWLPDAHSEAPAPASAMLSGSLLNCSLFAIWRMSQIASASHHHHFPQEIAIWMGTITAVAASLFLVRQHGLKRLWAYSSIENVGIMLVAIGFGSGALFVLQAVNHSLAKVSLFLLSGNIVQSTGTKNLSEISGLIKSAPMWSIILALSALAVTGVPPFGSFISEWMILSAGGDLGRWLAVALLLVALALSFIAVCYHVGRILFGSPAKSDVSFSPITSAIIPATLLAASLLLGILMPANFFFGAQ